MIRRPFVIDERERDPFKLQIRELPQFLDEIGLRNLLNTLNCPHPTACWIGTKAIEVNGAPTGAVRTFAFVEFASTTEAEAAFALLHRKETSDTRLFCSYAVKRRESTLKERNIEKEYPLFAATYCPPGLPDFPEDKMVNDNGKPVNGSHMNGTMLSVSAAEVKNSLVNFIAQREDPCKLCVDGSQYKHLHYIMSEQVVVDPSFQPPVLEDMACNSCGATSGLKKCTACASVFYCSRKCQIKDWNKHSSECSRETKSPPPPASFPPSANVTPVVTNNTPRLLAPAATERHLSTPVNARLEPIQKPLTGGGDCVDGAVRSPLSFVRTLAERKSIGQNVDDQAAKKAEAARAAELEKKRKEVEERKELEKRMQELKLKQDEAEAAAKAKQAAAARAVEAASAKAIEAVARKVTTAPEVRELTIGKQTEGMIVWQDEADSNIFYLTGDEKLIFEVIAPVTEKAGDLPDIPPEEGLHVIAKSVDDGAYYRAKVTKIIGDACVVNFIDYGNNNTIPLDGVKPLTGEIAINKIPAQAVKVIGATDGDAKKILDCFNAAGVIKATPTVRNGEIYKLAVA